MFCNCISVIKLGRWHNTPQHPTTPHNTPQHPTTPLDRLACRWARATPAHTHAHPRTPTHTHAHPRTPTHTHAHPRTPTHTHPLRREPTGFSWGKPVPAGMSCRLLKLALHGKEVRHRACVMGAQRCGPSQCLRVQTRQGSHGTGVWWDPWEEGRDGGRGHGKGGSGSAQLRSALEGWRPRCVPLQVGYHWGMLATDQGWVGARGGGGGGVACTSG